MAAAHAPRLERLSSRWTPSLRTLFPVVLGVAVGAALLVMAMNLADTTASHIVKGVAILIWVAAVVWAFRWFGRLRDVWLDGDDILVATGGRRVRVSLREVGEIRQTHFQKIKTITLYLTRNTPLGEKVRFVPHFALVPRWADHPVVKELRARRKRALVSDGESGQLRGPTALS